MNTRKRDFEAYIKTGGGIYAPSQCFSTNRNSGCGKTLFSGDYNDRPDPTPPFQADELYGFLPTRVSSVAANAPYTVLDWGFRQHGLVNSDVNDPTHNSFGLTGGLQAIDIGSAQRVTALSGFLNPCVADVSRSGSSCNRLCFLFPVLSRAIPC